ncbi:YbxH family protein [Heyndrickxia acidicola]|uniref:YbxH family protein n=1 Tax=Heyndrickxia acidicola TaxID=209389 RepID=A0ABU6MAH0_9BACI|nr:YbxH family protein [Heyndrickxia acidicola]MED1201616.1 YbxH family protein [Heyndrickxia acidicola]
MGAIERDGKVFEPEFSAISQKGAIHVYTDGVFLEEIPFEFRGPFPEHNLIEELVNHYCNGHSFKTE